MLIPVDMTESSNMYAIDLGSMRQKGSYIGSWGYYNRDSTFCVYTFDAFFFGKPSSPNRSKPLGIGTLDLLFDNGYAQEVDGLDTYEGMSVELVMDLCDNVKDGVISVKSVKTDLDALFGGGKVWSAEVSDEKYRTLVEAFFNLPQPPPGADGWFKRVKH